LNGKFRVGIDDFGAKFVGDVSGITTGKSFETNKPVWQLSVGNRKLDMFMPFAGEVVEVNPMVRSVPALSARDPYNQGWIFTVKARNREEALEKLVSPIRATQILKQHSERLHQRVNKELGITATDGSGRIAGDIPNRLNDAEWNSLTKEFFKSPDIL
jgi:glycine cleavage system H lipoate-binding protein